MYVLNLKVGLVKIYPSLNKKKKAQTLSNQALISGVADSLVKKYTLLGVADSLVIWQRLRS